MLGLVRRLLISILVLAAFVPLHAQDAPPPHAQVFSGFVIEFTPGSLAVSRKNASGTEMVHKAFTVDAHTKVEGKIKLKARVTVQFIVEGDQNHALRIIVRGG